MGKKFKITKKMNSEFNKQIDDILIHYGFSLNDFEGYEKKTKWGKLEVSLTDNSGDLWTVFTRFDEPQRAIKVFNCNPFSGKHNFHYSGGVMAREALITDFENFMIELDSIDL